MKKKLLISLCILVSAALSIVLGFKTKAQPNPKVAPMTLVSLRYFVPKADDAPVVFLGYSVKTYKENQDTIHRHISGRGHVSYFWIEKGEAYDAATTNRQTEHLGKGAQYDETQAKKTEEITRLRSDYKKDVNVMGINLLLTEGKTPEGFGYRRYFHPRFGEVQSEEQRTDGIEREMLVAVVPGIEEREFLNIPRQFPVIERAEIK